MSLETNQGGNDIPRKRRTSNQTGNNAPKFPWSRSSIGRTARIVAMCCAYHLKYNDVDMGETQKFPPAQDLDIFVKVLPWFPKHYDDYRTARALEIGYTGPIEPFNNGDVQGRIRYCFATPGSRRHDPKARGYGQSTEHHASSFQDKPGGRGEVFRRCSKEVLRRLKNNKPITIEEATEWGT